MKNKDNIFKKFIIMLSIIITIFIFWGFKCYFSNSKNIKMFQNKTNLLLKKITDSHLIDQKDEYTIFFSISDIESRAIVFNETDSSFDIAWTNGCKKIKRFLKKNNYAPLWRKVDIINNLEKLSNEDLKYQLLSSKSGYFHNGIILDNNYDTAYLAAELNGTDSINYKDGSIKVLNLNKYLKESKRKQIKNSNHTYQIFQTDSWFCDDKNNVYTLINEELTYGRRKIFNTGKKYILNIIKNSTNYLINQFQDDGSFIYGIYPQYNEIINDYNILRHAGTVWSLICSYKIAPDENLANTIEKSISYLIKQIKYLNKSNAFVLEEKNNELKLGGASLTVIVLTEYMDTFKTNKYKDICLKLGNGILSMLNKKTGKFCHVLNEDGSLKDMTRTIYYDGEATFALCKLYGLNKDKKWLDATLASINYFIKNNYEDYCSQWIAYSLNEITKYKNDAKLYSFALKNLRNNINKLKNITISPTYFEFLGNIYQIYLKSKDNNIKIKYSQNDINQLIYLIDYRLDRLLDNYFYPEYAMYMKKPKNILNAFMIRNNNYRVRIDDVQHSIGGLYLYYQNYDSLINN